MNNSIERRNFLKLGLLSAVSMSYQNAFSDLQSTSSKHPNVIIVISDDQGYPNLGAHGNKLIQTPHMDKMHAESVRLDNFHVDPTCAPSRAALMTGHYSRRAGVWHTVMGRHRVWKDEVLMPEIFRKNGYATGLFGKWHLGDTYPFRPQDRGFDFVVAHGGGGVHQTPDYWGNDYFDDTYFVNGKPTPFQGYCCDIWFDEAFDFIKRNKNRPFFCYITSNTPHSPFNVAKKYSQPYEGVKGVPNSNYFGMITNFDENLGRLRRRLKRLGLAENTILIFTSDNGPCKKVYNAGMRGQKGSQYDGGHRVPFFVYWPAGGVKKGRDVDHITAHIDLLPTLIDMCGLNSPHGLKFDGKSLKPLIMNENCSWPDRTLIVESQRIDKPEKWRKSAVMTDHWRLIDGKQLYDINADLAQKNDLSREHPETVKHLREVYEEWWQDVSRRDERYSRTIIGSPQQNPVTLTAHDWHPEYGGCPWHQGKIHKGAIANGCWKLDVSRKGRYRFELRRWPREADEFIRGGRKALDIKTARMKIDSLSFEKAVNPEDKAATFTVDLDKGPATLQTWFHVPGTKDRGAYYVYVELVE